MTPEEVSNDSADGVLQPPKKRQGWAQPGPGRPKGRKNNITLQQREVAEMVLGKPGTPEFEAFVASQRTQALVGLLAPAILQLWMHYLLGKPVDRVEVKDTTDDLDDASADQLRERARAIALRVVDSPTDADEASTH